MKWPTVLPNLNPIKNLCSIIKMCFYDSNNFHTNFGKQYKLFVNPLPLEEILSLNSMDSILHKVIILKKKISKDNIAF